MTGAIVVAIAGLTLGLASSAHCAAMCGPLVVTIGSRLGGSSPRSRLRHALLYHAGRALTYVALAIPAGLAGQTLVLSGLGRALAIGAGALLLMAAAAAIRLRPISRLTSAYSGLLSRVSSPVLHWAATRPVMGSLVAGALNGLLPCGLVYAAATAAAATGHLIDAVLLMAGFGIGTAVVLVAISVWAASFSSALRFRLRHVSPIVLAVTAVILIARGVLVPHQHEGDRPAPALHAHR